MAVNGTLVTPEKAAGIKNAGIRRVSISIDGATAESHDAFRQVTGAFSVALEGIQRLKDAGVEFQINTTITRKNMGELPSVHQLAENFI